MLMTNDCQQIARQRKAWLVGNGLTQKSLAKDLGVHISQVNKVITGARITPRIASYLVETVGMPAELFPSTADAEQQNVNTA